MMPRTKIPDKRRMQATYRLLGVRSGFIVGLRICGGGYANLSRLASCEKMCQEFSFQQRAVRGHETRPTQNYDALAVSLDAWKCAIC
jgi:hypothetical protein